MSEQSNLDRQSDNLWRCDCGDNGTHTNPDYHDYGCTYLLWYALQNFDNIEDDED